MRTALLNGGWVDYLPSFFDKTAADALFAELIDKVPWEDHRQPRLIRWYGDFPYVYTGASHEARPLPSRLDEMRKLVEGQVFGESRGQFRGVLLNLYRDGNDSVGYHADDEPVIKPDTPIASVSLGAERVFRLKYTGTPVHGCLVPVPVEYRLAHGSLLVMGGTTQRYWKHGVPKDPTVSTPRVNLTFREYNA